MKNRTMDYATEKVKLARLEKKITEARKQLNKKRAALREEKIERRKKEFDKLPLKERQIREMLGWSPYQADDIVRRTCGAIEVRTDK